MQSQFFTEQVSHTKIKPVIHGTIYTLYGPFYESKSLGFPHTSYKNPQRTEH